MRNITPRIFFPVLCAGVCSCVAGNASQQKTVLSSKSVVDGYKSWTKVNGTPHRITSSLSALCVGPSAEQLKEESKNPHLSVTDFESISNSKYITVYVNGIGSEPMMHAKSPAFPVGTVIVKEKLATPKSAVPELLTVMIKRDKGYNSECSDWEYKTTHGDGKKVTASGKLRNCQNCHAQWKSTDFVSRLYLSEIQRKKLK